MRPIVRLGEFGYVSRVQRGEQARRITRLD